MITRTYPSLNVCTWEKSAAVFPWHMEFSVGEINGLPSVWLPIRRSGSVWPPCKAFWLLCGPEYSQEYCLRRTSDPTVLFAFLRLGDFMFCYETKLPKTPWVSKFRCHPWYWECSDFSPFWMNFPVMQSFHDNMKCSWRSSSRPIGS